MYLSQTRAAVVCTDCRSAVRPLCVPVIVRALGPIEPGRSDDACMHRLSSNSPPKAVRLSACFRHMRHVSILGDLECTRLAVLVTYSPLSGAFAISFSKGSG